MESTYLVICLRSNDTDNLDYVFEFLWHHYRVFLMLIEAIVCTLNYYLPNFKFASGAEFGDELRVIDGDGIHDLIIFKEIRRRRMARQMKSHYLQRKVKNQPRKKLQKNLMANTYKDQSDHKSRVSRC